MGAAMGYKGRLQALYERRSVSGLYDIASASSCSGKERQLAASYLKLLADVHHTSAVTALRMLHDRMEIQRIDALYDGGSRGDANGLYAVASDMSRPDEERSRATWYLTLMAEHRNKKALQALASLRAVEDAHDRARREARSGRSASATSPPMM